MNTPLIEIKNVSLSFPHLKRVILSNLCYHVCEGDFIIILGSNGSGKSSLLKLLDQRYPYTSGHIYLNNRSLREYSAQQLSAQIKTITQHSQELLFSSLTLFENYLLFKKGKYYFFKKKKERQFLQDYLMKFNPNLSLQLDQMVLHLSGGEKQALALALTVLNPPKVLLLDEHTSALDPNASENIMQLTKSIITELNITCLLTTHNLKVAEQYGNKIIALKNGVIHYQLDKKEKPWFNENELLVDCY